MNGFDVSALSNPETRLLVVGPNWLGDSIMAMPALQVLRDRLHPQARLDLAVKPGQAGLWALHKAPDAVLALPPETRMLRENVRRLKRNAYSHVIFLPNSFRSALAPALAGIPVRRGTASQGRHLLINDPVRPDMRPDRHQQWENSDLLLPAPPPDTLPAPDLQAPDAQRRTSLARIAEYPRPLLALIPGAARGPSKCWPAERFLAVARAWTEETKGSTLWLGTSSDINLCHDLHRKLSPALSINLAGKTGLSEFAALLQVSDRVVANDSGGMHLAAALGTPVVAIFGLTSPLKTGPLHPQAVVVQQARTFDRAIARNSPSARAALEAVSAVQVIERVLAIPSDRG